MVIKSEDGLNEQKVHFQTEPLDLNLKAFAEMEGTICTEQKKNSKSSGFPKCTSYTKKKS